MAKLGYSECFAATLADSFENVLTLNGKDYYLLTQDEIASLIKDVVTDSNLPEDDLAED